MKIIDDVDFKSIIKVFGVGGGGSNAVNNMYRAGIKDVDFIICNTDVQALEASPIEKKIQLGKSLTQGLGAGNTPKQGEHAAREAAEELKEAMEGAKMIFITAGMGGGTGTGGAPVLARLAKEMDILSVAVVTIPFRFEGKKRIEQAIQGMQNLQPYVDAMIVIDNNKILEFYGDLPIKEAFVKADQVLLTAVKSIAEVITIPGKVNVDFADVQSVLKNSGVAIMSSAEASGENRAQEAAKKVIETPLLNIKNISSAKKILINISHPKDFKTSELEIINSFLQKNLGKNQADIIWGNVELKELEETGTVRVTMIATGFNTDIIPKVEDIYVPNGEKQELSYLEDETEYQSNTSSPEEDKNTSEEKLKQFIKGLQSGYISDFSNPEVIKKLSEEPAYVRLNFNN